MKNENRCEIKLPIEEFKDIIYKEEKEVKSPIEYLIKSCDYNIILDKKDAKVTLKLDINILSKEKIDLILLNRELVLLSSKVNRGEFGFDGKNYRFLSNGIGNYKIEINFQLPIQKVGNVKTIMLNLFSDSVLTFSLDKNKDYKISSKISLEEIIINNKKIVKSFIKKNHVTISWGNLAKEEIIKDDLETIIHSIINSNVTISETSLSCSSEIQCNIYQKPIMSIKVQVSTQIIDIKGAYIKRYDIYQENDFWLATIYFEHEIIDNYIFTIYYEDELEEGSTKLDIPTITIPNIEREEGFLVIQSKGGTDIKILENKNLRSIDNEELPYLLKQKKNIKEAFKYLVTPYGLSLEIVTHKEIEMLVSIINNAIFTTTVLKKGVILTKANLQVKNNNKPFIKIGLPKGAIPLSSFIKGNPIKPINFESKGIMLPLPKFTSSDELFWIELTWISNFKKMEKNGKIDLTLTDIDIPISHLYWKLYLPEKYKYKNFKGNIEHLDHFKTTPPTLPHESEDFHEELHESYSDNDYDYDNFEESIDPMVMAAPPMAIAPEKLLKKKRSKLKKSKPKLVKSKSIGKANLLIKQQVGKLPVKISIPIIGDVNYYEKLFVENKIHLNFTYKKNGKDKVKAIKD